MNALRNYGRIAIITALMGGAVMLASTEASAQSAINLGVGVNYSSGGGYGLGGAPMFGYGQAANMGYLGGACAYPGIGMGGIGMGGGQIPMISAPAPQPWQYGAGGWGGGYGSYPYPIQQGYCGVMCGAGMYPQPIYPVAGGPVGGGMMIPPGVVPGGNTTVLPANRQVNAWEIDDTASIVWGMALGIGMNSSTVAPVAFPRYEPTIPTNLLYSTGSRSYDFIARPHGL